MARIRPRLFRVFELSGWSRSARAIGGLGLGRLALGQQDIAEVALEHGVVGLELQGRAECDLGLGRPFLVLKDIPEVVVGRGVFGLELERGTVFGLGLRQLILVAEEIGDVEVGHGIVGVALQRGAGEGHGPGEDRAGFFGAAVGLQTTAHAAQVPRIVATAFDQVAEGGDGLVAAAHIVEQVGQVVRRLRPQGPGGHQEPHDILARDRRQACQGFRQGRNEREVVGIARRGTAKQADRRLALAGSLQGAGEQHRRRAGQLGRPRLAGQGLELRRMDPGVVRQQQDAEPVAVVVGVGGAGHLQRLAPRLRRPPGRATYTGPVVEVPGQLDGHFRALAPEPPGGFRAPRTSMSSPASRKAAA